MSEKQFIVEQLEIFNDENDFKGEYWWAVTNTERVEDCFECRNKEVALKLCDFLNKATDDFKWQIRQCEKWSAIVKQLKLENENLRKQVKSSETTSDATSNYNDHLESKITTIEKENEQLRKELNDCEKFRYTVFK